MSTVEFHRPPSGSLDASETGKSTQYLLVEAVGIIAWRWRVGKNRETVTATVSGISCSSNGNA